MCELDTDFQKLEHGDAEGLILSNSLLEPVLRISKPSDTYILELCGCVFKRGKHLLLPAPSVAHNWVEDGKFIKPLAKDIPVLVEKLLSGKDPNDLEYKEVLRIKRESQEPLSVVFSDNALLSAKDSAQDCKVITDFKGLTVDPYLYQKLGIAWMLETLEKTGGLILADEMGLGKTLQIIALFLLHPPANDSPALVVCPTSLIANWGREIMKFAPEVTFMIHRGNDRARIYTQLQRVQVVITTYDTMVNDRCLLETIDWTYLICDEAQALKNPESQRRRAVCSIKSKFTIPVTGTPVENSLIDLWSLADFAIPGILGTKDQFISLYPDSNSSAKELNEIVSPILLKRKLCDVAQQLPDRINIEVAIDLGSKLAEKYEQTRKAIIEKYDKAGQLVASGQLAIFCAHPWLVANYTALAADDDSIVKISENEVPIITPKIERCLELLNETFRSNKKAIIFAAYNNCREIIERAAAESGLPDAYWNAVNGSTPAEDRQSIIDDFSNYNGPAVLVLNPKAAGSGLNITAATVVIHFTQYWNPAVEAQASARAHRTGQDQVVEVYYLYYQNTVEALMLDRVEWRRELAEAAIPILSNEPTDANLESILSISPL